ncbi:SUKH-3 domain-containing protein [Streptomyces sp. 549]|uniref:SUKH-3 domain-containing protein n=1 Tax=Streptomyces sp. 549 TaxID=3049076 RepID=UPI0024C2F509|nr:SUKH-3 domain-containing protein [Streptomyces sp. 549]MDK1475616.1 SUKH-3 domain-containing protein [Streptomyces sp. 549]
MSKSPHAADRDEVLRQKFPDAVRVEVGSTPLRVVLSRYEAAGYPISEYLRAVMEDYHEVAIVWLFGDLEIALSVAVEDAIEIYPGNVRIYSRRVGKPLTPLGLAFDTEEAVLLAEDEDVYLAGDAGMQYVGNGFVKSVRALISGEWDKTFF